MSQRNLKCTEVECKQKRGNFIVMDMERLSTQIQQCETCNSGVFKTHPVAAQTYKNISLLWAERHNQITGRLH